jgi:opacity protein-like surface antigen
MRQLVLAALALVPLWSAAQAPADAAPAARAPAAQPSSGPQPIAIEPAAGPSSPRPVAAAVAGADRSYLLARLGTIVPRSSDLRGFHDGIAVEAGAGTRLTRYLAVEVGTGYLRTSQSSSSPDATGGEYHLGGDLSAVPLVATVRLLGRALGFEGYVLGGGGMYLWTYEGKETWSESPSNSFSGTDTGFGLHFGAGVSAALSQRVALGLEARYLLAKATFFGRTSELGSAIVTASLGYAF